MKLFILQSVLDIKLNFMRDFVTPVMFPHFLDRV